MLVIYAMHCILTESRAQLELLTITLNACSASTIVAFQSETEGINIVLLGFAMHIEGVFLRRVEMIPSTC